MYLFTVTVFLCLEILLIANRCDWSVWTVRYSLIINDYIFILTLLLSQFKLICVYPFIKFKILNWTQSRHETNFIDDPIGSSVWECVGVCINACACVCAWEKETERESPQSLVIRKGGGISCCQAEKVLRSLLLGCWKSYLTQW